MVEISLNGATYSVTRPKLQRWLELEKLRNKSIESAERQDEGFVLNIFAYLSALLDIPDDGLVSLPWYEILEGYYLSSIECAPILDLSILLSGSKKEKDSKLPDPWEYDERVWYGWVHLFAKEYGWKIDYIANLDVDDAFALIQEISLGEQFRKEWEWGLSEVAYEYSRSSKKSKLRKLNRPAWMSRANKQFTDKIKENQTTVKTNQSFIPPGVIIYDGQPNKASNDEGDSNIT